MRIFWQLLQLFFSVAIPLSVARGLWPRGSASEVVWARRRAEWLSVAIGLVLTYLVIVTVRALLGPDGPNPMGLLPFLVLAAVVPAAFLVLRSLWRRVHAAQEAERASIGTWVEPESARHRGLTGEDSPPTRW